MMGAQFRKGRRQQSFMQNSDSRYSHEPANSVARVVAMKMPSLRAGEQWR